MFIEQALMISPTLLKSCIQVEIYLNNRDCISKWYCFSVAIYVEARTRPTKFEWCSTT